MQHKQKPFVVKLNLEKLHYLGPENVALYKKCFLTLYSMKPDGLAHCNRLFLCLLNPLK